MPNEYSKNIVYLSKEQYQELIANGSITVNGVTVTYNENDLYVTPQAEPVTDVKVNGTSVTTNGVANVPVATQEQGKTSSTTGSVYVRNGYDGLRILQDSPGRLTLYPTNAAQIKSGSDPYLAVTTKRQHEATFYGLATAAGDTTQSQSNNPVGTYTDEAKEAIQEMLGVDEIVDSKAPIITSTASGAIASFNDGAENRKIDSLVVNIEPVQDLHGQEYPYPAGGGKNLFNEDDSAIQYGKFVNSSYETVDNKRGCISNIIKIKPDTYYAFSRVDAPSSAIMVQYDENGDAVARSNIAISSNVSATIKSNASADHCVITFLCASGTTMSNVVLKSYRIQMEESDSATAYAPYSNECPISGRTGANIQRAGKNMFDPNTLGREHTTSGNTIVTAESNRSVRVPAIPGVTYIMSADKVSTNGAIAIAALDSSGAVIQRAGTTTSPSASITANDNAVTILASINNVDGFTNVQLEYGSSTPTDYKPYSGTTVSVDWTTEAGTVYGGKLNVISGELTVDRATIDLATLTWTAYGTAGTNRRIGSNALPNVLAPSANNVKGDFITEKYKTVIYSALNYLDFSLIAMAPTGILMLGFDDVNYPSGRICYKLAEPIVYHLSPNEVRTLFGQNNIFADCGSIESVEYSADTKLYSDSHSGSGSVQDVQINGTSILQDGVANVPVASTSALGVVSIGTGLNVNSLGKAGVTFANESVIRVGSNMTQAIPPGRQYIATFYGLAKAAGDTSAAASSNPVGQYTETAKTAIRTMLGAASPDVIVISDTQPTNVDTKVWLPETQAAGVEVPTMADMNTALAGKVSDVQVNGASIVSNGVANVPVADIGTFGTIKFGSENETGLKQYSNTIYIARATDNECKAGTNDIKPIVPITQHRSVFYGLAKAAGDSTQSSSSNSVGTYTNEAKAAIKAMLGITDGLSDPVEVSGATPTITATKDTRYVCGEVSILTVTPPASGICIVRFTSGSTPTVLTATDVVWPEWFDVNNLEANTIYEICITDGVYGAVMTWPQTS